MAILLAMTCGLRHFLVLVFLAPFAAYGAGWQQDLNFEGEATVRAVVDGDTVVLDRPVLGKKQVRLVGLQAPKLPLGRKGFVEWPLAKESKSALEALVLGKAVRLGFGGQRMDRYGRLLAHLALDGGTWVQGEMLKSGMARVYTFPDNRALAAPMLRLEGSARSAKRGIWGHPFYRVRHAADERGLAGEAGTFLVIEGAVIDAARVKNRVYLNFGPRWRSDFTITIGPKAAKVFATAGVDPLAWESRRIRVRGWLRKRNGPMIEATHPEQIEALDD